MRQLQQLIISMMMIWSISSSVSGALVDSPSLGNPGTFGQVSNIGAIISSFLPVGEISNVAGVSKGWAHGAGVEFKQVVRELKAWKDGGGLIVTVFGNPTNEDISNYYRLKGVDAISRNMSADQIKDLLLSFVYIDDDDLRDQLSTKSAGFIQRQQQVPDRARFRLGGFLPNATTLELSQWLSSRNYDDEYYPGQSLQLTEGDRQKVFLRILKLPRQVADRPNEIEEVLLYMMKTKPLNSRYAGAYFQECLACENLNLSDLSKVYLCTPFFGEWEESEVAMNRMIEHPELSEWIKVYIIVLCKPYNLKVLKPAMQLSTTIPWIANKVWSRVKRLAGK